MRVVYLVTLCLLIVIYIIHCTIRNISALQHQANKVVPYIQLVETTSTPVAYVDTKSISEATKKLQTVYSNVINQNIIQQPIQIKEKPTIANTPIPTKRVAPTLQLNSNPEVIHNEIEHCPHQLWNCSSFYMDLGCLYREINIPLSPSPILVDRRVVQSSYSILTTGLVDEDDWFNSPYTFTTEWEGRFKLLQEEVFANYIATNKTEYDYQYRTSYTRLHINKAIDSGSGWIYAPSICYNRKNKKYHVFSVSGNPVNIRAHGKQLFRYGWSFEYHKGKVPEEEVTWASSNYSYIAMPFHSRHITHFAESVNLLLLKLIAPSEFPPFTDLYIPLFRSFDEYGWSKTYLSLLLSSFPVKKNITFFDEETVLRLFIKKPKPTYLCFPAATLMDRMAYNKDGGIFAGFFSADWMRALSYKHARVEQVERNKQLVLGILERSTDRKWVRLPRYIKVLESRFQEKLAIHRIKMNGLSYAQQVLEFYQDDIILGGHGSAMANVFFMRPHSALIECNPPYFFEMCFANIAMISRVSYFSVTNYNASMADISSKKAEALYNKGTFFLYRRRFAKYNIYPNMLSVIAAVDNAIAEVERRRFVFNTNDKWSRVFI